MVTSPLSCKNVKCEPNNLKKWLIYQNIAHIVSCLMIYEPFMYRLYFSRYKQKCPVLQQFSGLKFLSVLKV